MLRASPVVQLQQTATFLFSFCEDRDATTREDRRSSCWDKIILIAIIINIMAAKRGLPKRTSPEAVLYRSVAAYPTLLCRSGPLPQRSSAEAAGCGNTLPPNWSRTETKQRKFVSVCICNIPRSSGTAARDGNKKRDYVASSPLQRNHGHQSKQSAAQISNTTTALQSDKSRPCTCRKLGK